MDPRFNRIGHEIGAQFFKRFGNASQVIIQTALPKAIQAAFSGDWQPQLLLLG